MQIKMRKILAAFAAAVMVGSMTVSVYSEDAPADEAAAEETAAEETDSEGSGSKKKDVETRTEEEALASMEQVADNANFTLYYNDSEDLIALKNKKNDYIWWSIPINAAASNATGAQVQELLSGMTLVYGDPEKRRTSTLTSAKKSSHSSEKLSDGVKITYDYAEPGITIPVNIELCDDYLRVYVNTSEITEKDSSQTTGKLTTSLTFMSTFGAADMSEDGYFVIPDGSGAVVEFNNGRTGYAPYTGRVYGRNYTAVPTTKPTVTRQVYLPMYGIVKDGNGMMVVADKGDSCATINAYTSRQNKTDYNSCYFTFEIRTSDEYLMGGESNPLKVFEKRGIHVPEVEVRYYPLTDDEMDYIDIADSYRDYLIGEKNVEQKTDDASLYIDFFGGTIKNRSIAGIPVDMKTKITGFDDAKSILQYLNDQGTGKMIVNYNDWTNDGITGKIADSASPSGTLGGKSSFKQLLSYAEANNIEIYPGTDITTFESGGGYLTFTDTAVRVSNAFARTYVYDLAHGIQSKFYDPLSLLSPNSYNKAYTKAANSWKKFGLTNISFGNGTTMLYGDYGRKTSSREESEYTLKECYGYVKDTVGSILADGANAYAVPYADHITDIPLCSSKFDMFNYDIPFYQIVMQGLVPTASTAVNADPEPAKLILQAVASGAAPKFDLIHEEAENLKDTRYEVLYYAQSSYWADTAAGSAKFYDDVLGSVKDQKITAYNEDGGVITTVYENGTKVVTDLNERTASVDGKTYKLSDYIGEGAAAE